MSDSWWYLLWKTILRHSLLGAIWLRNLRENAKGQAVSDGRDTSNNTHRRIPGNKVSDRTIFSPQKYKWNKSFLINPFLIQFLSIVFNYREFRHAKCISSPRWKSLELNPSAFPSESRWVSGCVLSNGDYSSKNMNNLSLWENGPNAGDYKFPPPRTS